MTHARIWNRKDRKGGIEGLPLELLIVIVIATVGTAVLIGWMDDVKASDSNSYGEVSSNVSMIEIEDGKCWIDGRTNPYGFSMNVRVENDAGYGVEGAVVTLSGLGITDGAGTHPKSSSSGDYRFTGLTIPNHVKTGDMGFITVHVWHSELGDTEFKIPVVAH